MRPLFAFVFALFALGMAAQNMPFDQKVFDTWVDMRISDEKKTTYWYCYGEVYSYPDGKLITRMEGVDLGKMFRLAKDSVLQLNRKIFVYTDPITNEVLSEFGGKPVSHIEYPYQQITYALRNNKLVTYVTQGKGARLSKFGPGYNTTARKVGKKWMFSSPVFLNFPLPNGKQYEAYENYDFVVDTKQKATQDKYQLTWVRYGDLPVWAGGGKGVIQLVCRRVDSFEALSAPLKKHIREKAPLWLNPPKDLNEITELQK